MDWAKTALGLRDHAISVFQDEGNAPQVRARAYLYADVMQHFVGKDHPRPKCLPSIEAYQRAMIALLLRAYVSQGVSSGNLSYDAEKFVGWVRAVQAGPSQELLRATLQTMGAHMWPFIESYEGTFIDPDTTHEINRSVALHAFAVLTVLFVDAGIHDGEAPVLKILSTDSDQWESPEIMAPLLERVTALFSAKRSENGEWMEFDPSPSIIGFAHLDAEKAFIFDPDIEEAERIIDLNDYHMAESQEELLEGIKDAAIAIKEGNYPFLRGRKLACYRVGKEGILPRPGVDDTDDENEEEQEDGGAAESAISTGLSKPPDIFSAAYKDALTKMGMKNPHLQELRTQLDYAIFTGNGHSVLHFFQNLGDKFDEVLPTLGYGNNPLTQALAKQVYGNDDFYGATVFNVFSIDPRALYGDEPLTRALDDEKYEIACAIATHDGKYNPADELGTTWVKYRDQLSEQGTPYVTWQVLNCVAFSADEEAHAAAIFSIAEPGEEATYLSYHKQMAQTFLTSGGPYKLAVQFFNSQLADDATDELDGEEADNVAPEGDDSGDTSEVTKRLRDGAFELAMSDEVPRQVRARAYLYADTMHLYIQQKYPLPASVPSLMGYQCAMIGAVLKTYVNQIIDDSGTFHLRSKDFLEWSEAARTTCNHELLAATKMVTVDALMCLIGDQTDLKLSMSDVGQLDRFIFAHACAIIAVLIDIGDGESPLGVLCEEIHEDEWGDQKHIEPLIAQHIRPLFSLDLPPRQYAPAIIGFAASDFDTAYYFYPDVEEIHTLLKECGVTDDDEDLVEAFSNVMEAVVKPHANFREFTSELMKLPVKVVRQIMLSKNTTDVMVAVSEGTYPSQMGREPIDTFMMHTEALAPLRDE